MFDVAESLRPHKALTHKESYSAIGMKDKNNRHFLDLKSEKLQKMPEGNFDYPLSGVDWLFLVMSIEGQCK